MAMGMITGVTSRWERAAHQYAQSQQRSSDRTAFYASLTKGVRYLLQSAVLAVGAYLVIRGKSPAV
ncbi:hypothetical protein PSQ19_01495 [Devosia algicola]|uniref:HIG1 domain-containing protein n=1 Tax=Devosia algicola TaxID=3026418 RepID=A0ABY7YP03_9HYPH|nr:hypothetical protein [Devosia algicola]WDR02927.1 hypothetical protein PSQ19_01495 [Devosia algicola]